MKANSPTVYFPNANDGYSNCRDYCCSTTSYNSAENASNPGMDQSVSVLRFIATGADPEVNDEYSSIGNVIIRIGLGFI